MSRKTEEIFSLNYFCTEIIEYTIYESIFICNTCPFVLMHLFIGHCCFQELICTVCICWISIKKIKKLQATSLLAPSWNTAGTIIFMPPKENFYCPQERIFFVVSKSNTSLKFTSLSNVETQVWMHNFSQMSRGPLNRTLNLMWTQAIVERLRFEHIRNKTV